MSASTSDEVTVALPQDPHETWVAGLPINSYANPTLIEVVLRGSITAYYYDQTSTYWPLWGEIDGRGLHTNLCYGRVGVRYANGAVWSAPGTCPMPPGDPQPELRGVLTVSGSGTASRAASPGGPYGCNGGPCRLYTGGPHTVTVRRIPAELKLSPTRATIEQGE